MRKLIFFGCIALAVSVGLILGVAEESWGLAIMSGLKLGILGAVVGALLSNIGRKSSEEEVADEILDADEEMERVGRLGGQGMSPEEVSANYWRDKGHPPFINPEDYDPHA